MTGTVADEDDSKPVPTFLVEFKCSIDKQKASEVALNKMFGEKDAKALQDDLKFL